MNHLFILYSLFSNTSNIKKMKMKLSLPIILLCPVFFTVLFFRPRSFSSTASLPVYGRFTKKENEAIHMVLHRNTDAACTNMQNNSICCDRRNYHTDICFMQGDVRSHASSSSIFLFSENGGSSSNSLMVEKIRPYTRKWETSIMNHIPELSLKSVNPKHFNSSFSKICDVKYNVTALFFSLGGYTGNIFHSFSNGIIPLYITSQHLNRQVVFVVLEYRNWWYEKYREILSQLSDYPLIDFTNDTRIHCFPSAIIGLQYHEVLTIDPSRMNGKKTINEFRNMLGKAYQQKHLKVEKPRLVIVARRGTRAIENENEVVNLAKEIGFSVETLIPKNTMPLYLIHKSLSSCDVLIGVHGAALTHFLFMKPGSLFIQIVPLGLEGLAQSCFGNATKGTGITYEEYRILPKESSLYRKYGGRDPIVIDPESVKAKGWYMTKNVYLEGQNVSLDVDRLRSTLEKAYKYSTILRKN